MVASVLVVLLSHASLWRPIGDMLFDVMMQRTSFVPNEQIVIVTVDDAAIDRFGGWPLDRSLYAEFLEALAQSQNKPRVVGLNLLFLDHSASDQHLARAMAEHRVVLPVGVGVSPGGSPIAVRPVPVLASASELSHINASLEPDGSVRGVRVTDLGLLHFSLAMRQLALQETPLIDTHGSQEMRRVHIMDPGAPYLTVSLADALEPFYPREQFKDKYVLLGVTSPSLGDRFSTMYSGKYNSNTPGVAVLASVLQAALTDQFIDVGSPLQTVVFNLLGLWLILIGLLFLSPLKSFVWLLAFVGAWLIAAQYFLTSYGVWLDPSPLIFSVILFQILWAWRRTVTMTKVIVQGASVLGSGLAKLRRTGVPQSPESVTDHELMLGQAIEAANWELSFLSLVIDELPEALAIFSTNQGLLLWNGSFERLCDAQMLNEGAQIDEFASWLGVDSGSMQENQVKLVKLTMADRASLATVDAMLKISQLHIGRIGSVWVLVLSDISELRRLEQQRDKALQFLSHDMRTPVASILAMSEQSESPVPGIEQHAERLLQMMNDFCLMIRSEEPTYAMHPELLQNLVDDALAQVIDLARSRQVKVHFADDEEPIFVTVNAQLLIRALVNLLHNAVKFATRGSAVRLRAFRTNANMVIIEMVNDVDPCASQNEQTGFGLGLEFVQRVMENHQGHLIRDIPLSGKATVSLCLPVLGSDRASTVV